MSADPEYFRRIVRKFQPYDCRALLRGLCWISMTIDEKGENGVYPIQFTRRVGRFPLRQTVYLTQHYVGMLAKLIIERGRDSGTTEVPNEVLIDLIGMCSQLTDQRDLGSLSRDELLGFGLRIAWQQLPLQDTSNFLIARAKLLFDDAEELARAEGHRDVDTHAEFQRLTGMTIDQFRRMGVLIYSNFMQYSAYTEPIAVGPGLEQFQDLVAPEMLARFHKMLSLPVDQLRTQARNHSVAAGFDAYGWNPLQRYPIVYVGQDLWSAPVIPYLLMKIADLPYWIVEDAFTGGGVSNPYRTHFGFVFEHYLGIHLRHRFGQANVYHESQIIERQGVGRPDWVVMDGDTALILESRAAGLSLAVRTAGDITEFNRFMTSRITSVLKTMRSKIAYLETGNAGIPWQGIKHVYLIVVTYQALHPEFLMKAEMQRMLEEDGVTGLQFEWMDVNRFEDWVASNPTGSPSDTLLAKWSRRNGHLEAFADFIVSDDGKPFWAPNALLQEVYDSFFRSFRPPAE